MKKRDKLSRKGAKTQSEHGKQRTSSLRSWRLGVRPGILSHLPSVGPPFADIGYAAPEGTGRLYRVCEMNEAPGCKVMGVAQRSLLKPCGFSLRVVRVPNRITKGV